MTEWGGLMETGGRLAVASLVHATALVALAGLLVFGLRRRLSPALRAAVWLVVLLKFFVPPVLPGRTTLSGWLSHTVPMAAPPAILPPRPAQFSADVGSIIRSSGIAGEGDSPAPLSGAQGGVLPGAGFSWLFLLAIAYLAGLACMVVRLLVAWRQARGELAAMQPGSAELQSLLRTLGERVGLRRAPDVRIAPGGSGPYICRPLRPILVIPKHCLKRLSPQRLEAVLLHELVHLKRGDLWVRVFENVARCVFFFWPVVWWVCRQIDRNAEAACDRRALALCRIDPTAYAETLLSFVRLARGDRDPAPATAVAFASRDGRRLEYRFRCLFESDARLQSQGRRAMLLVSCWAVFALAGGAVATDDDAVGVVSPPAMEPYVQQQVAEAELQDQPGPDGSAIDDAQPAHASDESRGRPLEPQEWTRFMVILSLIDGVDRSRAVLAADAARLLNARPESDANGDGQLDEAERAALAETMRGEALKRLVTVVPAADRDRDGEVSQPEYRVFRAAAATRIGRRLMEAEGTGGGDRAQSLEQTRAALLAWFDTHRDRLVIAYPRADLNRDGQLTRGEARAFFVRQALAAGAAAGAERPLPGQRLDAE